MIFPNQSACVAALLIVLALTACGSGGGDPKVHPRTRMSSAEIATLPKFKIEARPGPAPHRLEVRDIRKGSGAVVKPGDTLLLDWGEAPYGESAVASPRRYGQPQILTFDGMLAGWEIGLPGMRVGGRRELVVPPRLTDVPATRVYQIDVLAIERPSRAS